MNLGPAEILIVVLMVLCLFAGPALVLVGFLMLFRRVERVEQELKALQEKQT